MRITDKYRQLNVQLHETRPDFGVGGKRWSAMVMDVANAIRESTQKKETPTVLDYGCGKGSLAQSLPMLNVANYDPAVEAFKAEPVPADIVVCTDVLEHVEPECLEEVFAHIQSLAKKAVAFSVATRPAIKELADGRNAHLIVEPYTWWLAHLTEYWDMVSFNRTGDSEFVAVFNPFKEQEDGGEKASEQEGRAGSTIAVGA